MRKLLLAGAAWGLLSAGATAADMPIKTPLPPVPVFSWTGLYAGGNVGWAQLEDNGFPFCLDPTGALGGPGCDVIAGGQIGANGLMGGGQVGYNWQAGKLVLGIEADMQGTDLKGSVNVPGPFAIVGSAATVPGSFTASESVTWLGTLRGRFGVAFDRLLIYMTGGLAMGGADVSQTHIAGLGLYSSNTSRTLNGWTFGGGVEWAVLGNWSVKGEGGYYDLGTIATSSAAIPAVPASFLSGKNFDARGAFARVGLNFKFWAPPPAVDATTY
jgi:outer membrane immunogenic protein